MYIGVANHAGQVQAPKDPLPGQPHISLHDAKEVVAFVSSDMIPRDLDRIAPKLWWLSKKDSANISPLHRQRVKGREVVITEEPRLHLLWAYDRIFVKPLPEYLIDPRFWEAYPPNDLRQPLGKAHKATRGFLRSYAYVIKHESDFNLARTLHLLPPGVTWAEFATVRPSLLAIKDCECSPRYSYGEIRLNRLNFYAPFLLRRRNYQRLQYHYSTFFHKFFAPILFGMAMVSLILSGLGVISQVQAALLGQDIGRSLKLCQWLSFAVIVTTSIVGFLLFAVLLFKLVGEWVHALSQDTTMPAPETCDVVVPNEDKAERIV